MDRKLSHLPAWAAGPIARYDAMVEDGEIAFDDGEFASRYPGQAETDEQLASFVASHTAD